MAMTSFSNMLIMLELPTQGHPLLWFPRLFSTSYQRNGKSRLEARTTLDVRVDNVFQVVIAMLIVS